LDPGTGRNNPFYADSRARVVVTERLVARPALGLRSRGGVVTSRGRATKNNPFFMPLPARVGDVRETLPWGPAVSRRSLAGVV
jgi:hypothetical protein